MSSINRTEGNENGEEGIKVAIRMRPLNTKETKAARVWRVLQKYNSITQTTSEGKPLPERVTGRTFFTFDKTFGEKSTTREVYNEIAQGIVESVVNGLNGTIFAYGQTSSGKTHTMQGSGTIEDGQGTGGGVVHMAARDIFSLINNDPERVFLLRVSFIEIYNEEVRDLLVSGNDKVLKIREDNTRGVFVDATENIVTDFQSLLSTLFAGEKHRAFASTGMNERSSRSHTIFRITVESRRRKQNDANSDDDSSVNSDDDDDDEGDGAVRVSTLNLVDLAGSESVRHTGATGDRLKEGAKINQSLLSLSRVIAALGSPSRTHINFRDSKLTRILQSSLSGNARMAIICCATPSEMYLEETRSTLQFASRAKLVKTRATINEVLDERSMIKKLQRELAAAKRAAEGEVDMTQLRELESEAARAENIAKEVQEKYEKLKASILKGGMFNGTVLSKNRKRLSSKRTPAKDVIPGFLSPSTREMDRKRRRQSDGILRQCNSLFSPLLDVTNRNDVLATFTPTVERKSDNEKERISLLQDSGSFQIILLKEALAAKSEIARNMDAKLDEWKSKATEYEKSLGSARFELDVLKKDQASSASHTEILTAEKEALELQRQDILDELKEKTAEKDKTIQDALATIEAMLLEKEALERSLEEMESITKQNKIDLEDKDDALSTLRQENDNLVVKLQLDISGLKDQNEKYQSLIEEKDEIISASLAEISSLKEQVVKYQLVAQEKDDAISKYLDEIPTLKDENERLQKFVVEKDAAIGSMSEEISTLKDQHEKFQSIIEEKDDQLTEFSAEIVSLTCENKKLNSFIGEKDDKLSQMSADISCYKDKIEKLERIVAEKDANINDISSDLASSNEKNVKLLNEISVLNKKQLDVSESGILVSKKFDRLNNVIIQVRSNLKSFDTMPSRIAELRRIATEVSEDSNDGEACFGLIQELILSEERFAEKIQTEKMRCEDYIHKNTNLQEQLQLLSAAVDKLTTDLETREGMVDDLVQEKTLAEALAHQLSEAEDSALAQIHKLSDRLHQLQDDLCAKTEENRKLEDANKALEENLRLMESTCETTLKDNQHYVSVNTNLQEQLQLLSAAVDKLTTDLETREGMVDDLVQEKTLAEALAHQLSEAEDSALAQIHKLSDRLHQLQDDLCVKKSLLVQLNEEKELSDSLASQMSASEDYLMLQVQSLSNELHQTKNQLSRVQSEYEKERENCIHEDLSDLRNEKNALNASLEHHRILVEKLSKENESLLKEVEDNKCHLDKLLQNVQDNDININRKVELIEAELLAKDECIKERERTIIKLEHDLEKSNAELAMACMNLEIEMQKFSDANQELKHLRREFCAANKSSKIDTDQMQQIEELKQLLASANAREEEARKIALATDEELGRKEKEYEKAVLYASECETAAKEWEQKYNHIVSRQSTSCHHDTEDILREMELLLEEKLELEKLLEQAASEEDSKLKSLEQELRKMYEEKQTEMLHEADSLMRGLKEDLALKEKELEKCKQDAQTTREKLILVEEQLKSDHTAAIDADEKVLQLSEQLSNAEETSSQLTKKLSNLQEEYEEFKRHVSSSRESYKQALEGKLINAKDEIASLKERLHEETSKARSYQEKADIFRKEISRIELEMSSTKESLLKEKEFALNKLKGDFAAAKVELSKANADIFTLNQDIEHYRETVNNLKQTSISREDFITYKHQMQQQEVAIKSRDEEIHKLKMSALGYKDEIKTLRHNLMDLESKLLSKDERIKNLEAKRLTKEHVAMIKKLKDERRIFKDNAEDLKRKLTELEQSLSQRSKNESEKFSNGNSSDDFAKLQAKNDALEKKLRKYISHYESLTKEKQVIQEIIQNDIQSGTNNSMSAAVTALCERLHMLEEERTELLESKQNLQEALEESTKKLHEVAMQKTKLEETLNEAREEVSNLNQKQKQFQQIAENVKSSAKDLEEEKNRQVSYLEKENLQILEENRKLKQELRCLKTHSKPALSAFQEEPTEDLGSILSNFTYQDKENNENGVRKSTAHIKQSNAKARVGLGSGEGEVNEDNTQECHQS